MHPHFTEYCFLCLENPPYYLVCSSWILPVYSCFSSRLHLEVTFFGGCLWPPQVVISLVGSCRAPCMPPSTTHLIHLWILHTGSDTSQIYVGKSELNQKVILDLITSWSSYDIHCLQGQILATTMSACRHLDWWQEESCRGWALKPALYVRPCSSAEADVWAHAKSAQSPRFQYPLSEHLLSFCRSVVWVLHLQRYSWK